MSIINATEYCPDCKSADFIWYDYGGYWQCDACWDDWTESRFGYRQYKTEREAS